MFGNKLFSYFSFCFSQGIYVTEVQENSPAAKAGLRVNDKILQVCKWLLFSFTE